jgi:hypothetical protein
MRHDERRGDPRSAHVAREREEQPVEQQLVQHRVRLAEQPLDRAGESGEFGDAPGREQLHHVPSHGVEEPAIVGRLSADEGASLRLPRFAQLGTGAEQGGLEECVRHRLGVSGRRWQCFIGRTM